MIANLIWKSKSGGANDSKYIAIDHEYLLCYAKKAEILAPFMDNKAEVTTSYNMSDEKGEYALDRLDKQSIRYSDSLDYEIIGPDGMSYRPKHKDSAHPNASWRWSKETVRERYDELVFKNGCVYTKNYKKESNIARSLLFDERFGRTRTGKTELFGIGNDISFTAPKPSKLINHLLNIVPKDTNDSTILDFFAGSGTTLHAVMQLNKEDGGHRQCILVTNNENNICREVTYERNKRVIEGYTTPKGVQVKGLRDNNLRYYRTQLLPRERTNRNMRRLVTASTDLLCIKEELWERGRLARISDKDAAFFSNGQRAMVVIYNEEAIPEVVEWIVAGEPPALPVKVYVFSPGAYAWDDDFAEVIDRVELCALPEAIYQAYKSVLPKKRVRQETAEESPKEGGEE